MDRCCLAGTLWSVEGRKDTGPVRPVQHRPEFQSYLLATNKELSLTPPKEMVYFILQVTMAVGHLTCLIIGANSISGERENGTFESLLVTPVRRRQIILG
jgi:ABC-type transport system involved in multi-copper enzyme maturation permease subunit